MDQINSYIQNIQTNTTSRYFFTLDRAVISAMFTAKIDWDMINDAIHKYMKYPFTIYYSDTHIVVSIVQEPIYKHRSGSTSYVDYII